MRGGYKNIEPRWKKGESGNPAGKKKGVLNSKTRLKMLLEVVVNKENPFTNEFQDFNLLELMDMKQIQKAIDNGDTNAYKEILDRLEGKSNITQDESVTNYQPIVIQLDKAPPPTDEPTV
jgi:hypothetical protein